MDQNVAKALTSNSHHGLGAVVKSKSTHHKDALEAWGLGGSHKSEEVALTPAATPTQSVEAAPPAIITQAPVVDNVLTTISTSVNQPSIAEKNSSSQEQEEANIAIATATSLETNDQSIANSSQTNTNNVTAVNQVPVTNADIIVNDDEQNTQESEIDLEKLAELKKITDALIEYGVVGRSQQKDIEALAHEDIAMKKSLEGKVYNEDIKNSLVTFYNIILKLTP